MRIVRKDNECFGGLQVRPNRSLDSRVVRIVR